MFAIMTRLCTLAVGVGACLQGRQNVQVPISSMHAPPHLACRPMSLPCNLRINSKLCVSPSLPQVLHL